MISKRKLKFIRMGILGLLLILITIQGYLHQVKGGGEAPSIHALCPYGGLESLYSYLGSGTFIQKIFTGTMVLFFLTIILALLFRRCFCGLLCPFGALQEYFALLGKKIFKRHFKVNKKLDTYLRYLKYVVLLITAFYAWKTAGLWMSPYDPWSSYAHLSEGVSAVIEENLIGFILLIITIVASILYDRFFCKYLCPMGALYGIISKISPNKIVRNEDKCVNCNLCTKSCPMNIDIANNSEINSAECINCQLCVLSCPKEGCLENKHIFSRKLKPALTITLVVLIFIGVIAISKSVGIFTTLPKAITTSSTITSDEIKGYMTLEDLAIGLKIDIEELYKKLNITEEVPQDTKLKDVKNYIPEFSVEEAKEKLKNK